MKATILGNGPSKEEAWPLTSVSETHKELHTKDGFTIGCNFTEGNDLMVVTDQRLMGLILMGKEKPDCGVIVGPKAFNAVLRERNVLRKFNMVGTVTPRDSDKDDEKNKGLKDVQNAGQVATLWALRVGFDEILLVGFDSLWTKNRASSTNALDPRAAKEEHPKVMARWAGGWHRIFQEFPEANIRARCPKGVTLTYQKIQKDEYTI